MTDQRSIKDILGKKLILSLLVPFYLIVILGLVFLAFFIKVESDKDQKEFVEGASKVIEYELDRPIHTMVENLSQIEKKIIDPSLIQTYLNETLINYPELGYLMVLDSDGEVVYTTTNQTIRMGFDYSRMDGFLNGGEGEIHWGKLFNSNNDDGLSFQVSYKGPSGYVIMTDIYPVHFQVIVDSLGENEEKSVAITSLDGKFIAHSDIEKVNSRLSEKEQGSMTSIGEGKKIFFIENSPYQMVYKVLDQQGIIISSYSLLSKVYNSVFLLAVICLVLLMFLTYFIIRYLTNHTQHILNALDDMVLLTGEVSNGNYGTMIEGSNYEELNELIGHFNAMTNIIKKNFDSISKNSAEMELLNEALTIQNRNVRESELQIEMIIDNTYDGVLLLDTNQNILRYNQALWVLFDVPADRIGKYKKCYEIFGNNKNTCDCCNLNVVERTGIKQIMMINREDKVIEELTVPFYDEGDELTGFIKTYRDVTEQKALEKKVNRATKMEAIGRLTSGIAHDFNNILQVILGYSEMLHYQMNKEVNQEDLLHKVDSIRDAAQKAERLIRKLMTFSKIDQVKMENMNINETVMDISHMVGRIIGENIDLNMDLDVEIQRIRADKTQIEQIVVNLCVNAKDAIEDQGQITIKTYDTLRRSGQYVCLEISDTGCGMEADIKDKIFEPFFSTKDLGHGTGLGLATVMGIVESHKGTIEVDSELGSGTTFRIIFPVDSLDTIGLDGRKKIVNYEGLHVLFVEDDPLLLNIHKNALENLGIHVLTARSGMEALTIYSHQFLAIDLVILDSVVPDLDGLAIFEHLRAIYHKVRVLIAVAINEPEIVEAKSLFKNLKLVRKPYSSHELINAVADVVYDEHFD